METDRRVVRVRCVAAYGPGEEPWAATLWVPPGEQGRGLRRSQASLFKAGARAGALCASPSETGEQTPALAPAISGLQPPAAAGPRASAPDRQVRSRGGPRAWGGAGAGAGADGGSARNAAHAAAAGNRARRSTQLLAALWHPWRRQSRRRARAGPQQRAAALAPQRAARSGAGLRNPGVADRGQQQAKRVFAAGAAHAPLLTTCACALSPQDGGAQHRLGGAPG